MAGGELYGVWVQTVTNDTTAANVERYGEIEDMAQAYRDGFAKDFCDGQTSPTPPRWPDDGMQLVYAYDRESARLISEFLREDVASRVAGGEMGAGFSAPSWLGDITAQGLRAAAEATLTEAIVAPEIAATSEAAAEPSFSVLRNARIRLNIDDATALLQERGLNLEMIGWDGSETMMILRDDTGRGLTMKAKDVIRFLTQNVARPEGWE